MVAIFDSIKNMVLSRDLIQSILNPNDINSLMNKFGYKLNPSYDDFYFLYRHVGLAKRGIDATVDLTWRKAPIIESNDSLKTSIDDIQKKYNIYGNAKKADRLACIGRYSVIVINASGESEKPLRNGDKFAGISVFGENQATVAEWESDSHSPRYGMPKKYKITPSGDGAGVSLTYTVHHSRIIHVIEDVIDSEIYGIPKLEPAYNTLHGITKTIGAAVQMFWHGAYQGLAFSFDKDMNISDETLAKFKDSVNEYQDGLRRTLGALGLNVQQLSPGVADPGSLLDRLIQMYSAEINTPTRLLLGSEQGQLASSVDQDMFLSRIGGRRETFAGNVVLIPLLQRLIDYEMLPKAKEWSLKWPDLIEESLAERESRVSRVISATRQYVGSHGNVSSIITVEEYREMLGLLPEIPKTKHDATGDYGESVKGLPNLDNVSYMPMQRNRKT